MGREWEREELDGASDKALKCTMSMMGLHKAQRYKMFSYER